MQEHLHLCGGQPCDRKSRVPVRLANPSLPGLRIDSPEITLLRLLEFRSHTVWSAIRLSSLVHDSVNLILPYNGYHGAGTSCVQRLCFLSLRCRFTERLQRRLDAGKITPMVCSFLSCWTGAGRPLVAIAGTEANAYFYSGGRYRD